MIVRLTVTILKSHRGILRRTMMMEFETPDQINEDLEIVKDTEKAKGLISSPSIVGIRKLFDS